MKPAGILFDIDHTLVIDNKLERVAMLHLLEHVRDRGGRACGSLDEESAAADELLHAYRSGACGLDAAIDRFVERQGVRGAPEHGAFFRDRALQMTESFVVAEPGARSALARLAQRGHTLGVLSNGWNPLQEAKARCAGYTGRVIASDDLGWRKPDPRAFRAAADAFGLDVSQTWYVGDDPRADIAGASEAGMHTVWIARGEYPAGLAPPSRRINSLAELADAVALAPAGVTIEGAT